MADKNIELFYLHRPVANITALKAVNTTLIVDGELINVSGLGSWQFIKASTTTADDITVVAPTVGGGRWVKQTLINASGQVVIPKNVTASTILSIDAASQVQSLLLGTSLTLAANLLNTIQDIRVTASPTFAGLTDTGLTANTIVSCNGSKTLQTLLLGNSLTLAANILDTIQDIRITAIPTFNSIIASGLTASTIVSCTAGKQLQSLSLGNSLSLAINVLDTIQDIRTTATPTFVSVIASGLTASTIVSCTAGKQLQSLGLGASLSLVANTLDTIQDIRTTATPLFVSVTANIITDSLTEKTLGNGVVIPTGIFGKYQTEPTFTPGSTQWASIKYVDDKATSVPSEVVDILVVANDGQTSFTLSQTPDEITKVLCFYNGVSYPYGYYFTVSGTTVTWLNTEGITTKKDRLIEFVYNNIFIGSDYLRLNSATSQTVNSDVIINGAATVTTGKFASYQTHPTFTVDTQIVDKKYVDDTFSSTGYWSRVLISGSDYKLVPFTAGDIIEVPSIKTDILTEKTASNGVVIPTGIFIKQQTYSAPTSGVHFAPKQYVDTALGAYVLLTSGTAQTIASDINLNGALVISTGKVPSYQTHPVSFIDNQLVDKKYVDTAGGAYVLLTSVTSQTIASNINLNGNLTISTGKIPGYQTEPTSWLGNQFASVNYVDTHSGGGNTGSNLLIAGDFAANPWKRGTAFTGSTAIPNYSGLYHADMWMTLCSQAEYEITTFSSNFYDSFDAQIAVGDHTGNAVGTAQILDHALNLSDRYLSFSASYFTNMTAEFAIGSQSTDIVYGSAQETDHKLNLTDTFLSFQNSFDLQLDAEYSVGSPHAVSFGGAAIAAYKLDLAHNDVRYVWWAGLDNVDSIQVGTIQFRYIPNYSGTPSTDQAMVAISNTLGDTKNEIILFHDDTGNIYLDINDPAGAPIISAAIGAWSPISGTGYDFELHYDLTTGNTWLKINTIQLGSTITTTGTRDSSIGVLIIGTDPLGTLSSNFSMQNFFFIETKSIVRYVTYNAQYNADSTQKGEIRFTYTPNYSASPTGNAQAILNICKAFGDSTNLISINHYSTGHILFAIKDSADAYIVNADLGAWSPVAGTSYDFVIYYNITDGATYITIDDAPFGAIMTGTGVRDSNIGTIVIGTFDGGLPERANFSFSNFDFYKVESVLRYVYYDGVGNVNYPQYGRIQFDYIPNYNDEPDTEQDLVIVSKALNDVQNLIHLYHDITGYLWLHINNSSSGAITNAILAQWMPSKGQSYHFELHYDLTNGNTFVKIDGEQIGSTILATGTRDTTIGILLIGTNLTTANNANFSMRNFVFSKYTGIVIDVINISRGLDVNNLQETMQHEILAPNTKFGTTQIVRSAVTANQLNQTRISGAARVFGDGITKVNMAIIFCHHASNVVDDVLPPIDPSQWDASDNDPNLNADWIYLASQQFTISAVTFSDIKLENVDMAAYADKPGNFALLIWWDDVTQLTIGKIVKYRYAAMNWGAKALSFSPEDPDMTAMLCRNYYDNSYAYGIIPNDTGTHHEGELRSIKPDTGGELVTISAIPLNYNVWGTAVGHTFSSDYPIVHTYSPVIVSSAMDYTWVIDTAHPVGAILPVTFSNVTNKTAQINYSVGIGYFRREFAHWSVEANLGV